MYLKILLIAFVVMMSQCKGQNIPETDTSQAILDSIISIAKQQSYYTTQVDWEALQKEMYQIYAKSDSIDKIGKPSAHMFKMLGDFHGMLMYDYKKAYNHRTHETGPPNDSTYRQIGQTKINTPYLVNGQILEKTHIAYIEILGTGVMQEDQIMLARDEIRNKICVLKEKKPIRWIIDLRCNIGGNMHPMMAGIAELIPNAALGGDTKDSHTYYNIWSFKEGNFYENGYANYKTTAKCSQQKKDTKIAVLTSQYTASAGEVVVSSLKGQPNVKVIGQKTSGLSSTNGWFVLSKKWVLAPMIGYYMSQDSTVHTKGIIPDISIDTKLDVNQLLKGAVIDRAILWIEKEN